MSWFLRFLDESWALALDASVYVIFGLLVAGLLRVLVSPAQVARHLGHGRVKPVLKAALFGIPMPLCSCGVIPAAASLKKQGANSGATAAFLISTPESGVDSIAITYALLDPIMTVARPLAAFATATAAGLIENFSHPVVDEKPPAPDLSCTVDHCCDGQDCPPTSHAHHHSLPKKLRSGLGYAFGELWADLAGWFIAGLLLAGAITALVPSDWMSAVLGGGILSMLLMVAFSVPLYVCATASTPIAAALILKGVSPGAALVLMLAGPATNMASLTMLVGLLGKRATAIYLGSIVVMSVLCGLALDWVYGLLGISAQATVRQAAEVVPLWAQWTGALLLVALSVKPLYRWFKRRFHREPEHCHEEGCDHS